MATCLRNASIPLWPSDQNSRFKRTTSLCPPGRSAFTAARSLAGSSGTDGSWTPPAVNAERTLALARRASDEGAALVVFPELGLSGYAIEDLFHQQAVTESVLQALERVVAASADLAPLLVVGAPLRAESGLFNAAVVVHRGRVLGAVPKTYLPEYREFYEKRHFRAARDVIGDELVLLSERVPFGPRLLFACADHPDFVLHVEICEDLWSP